MNALESTDEVMGPVIEPTSAKAVFTNLKCTRDVVTPPIAMILHSPVAV